MTLVTNRSRPDARWAREARQVLKELQQQQRKLQALIDAAEATPADTPLQFFEEVRIVGGGRKLKPVTGKFGVILGRAQDEAGQWNYAVAVEGDETWSVEAKHLASTGRLFSRDSIYSGERVRVRVDSKGRGSRTPRQSK